MRRVLLDSNLIIYTIDPDDRVMPSFVVEHVISCSAISRVETLGFHRLSARDAVALSRFFQTCRVFAIDAAVIERSIGIRQRRKMSLGDSLIAATALAHGLTLATRNVDDFAWIEELSVVNPYAAS